MCKKSTIIKSSYDIILKYKIDICSDFTRQLLYIKTLIGHLEHYNMKDLLHSIIKYDLAFNFPDIITACNVIHNYTSNSCLSEKVIF